MGNNPVKKFTDFSQNSQFNVCDIRDRGGAAEIRQKDDNQKKATGTPLLDVNDRRKLNEAVHCEKFTSCQNKSQDMADIKKKYNV
jgi:hypothetical protein